MMLVPAFVAGPRRQTPPEEMVPLLQPVSADYPGATVATDRSVWGPGALSGQTPGTR